MEKSKNLGFRVLLFFNPAEREPDIFKQYRTQLDGEGQFEIYSTYAPKELRTRMDWNVSLLTPSVIVAAAGDYQVCGWRGPEDDLPTIVELKKQLHKYD